MERQCSTSRSTSRCPFTEPIGTNPGSNAMSGASLRNLPVVMNAPWLPCGIMLRSFRMSLLLTVLSLAYRFACTYKSMCARLATCSTPLASTPPSPGPPTTSEPSKPIAVSRLETSTSNSRASSSRIRSSTTA